MLVVHWSPVNHSKSILKNGIRKSSAGVYCYPLTGHLALDRWWMKALKRLRRDGKTYNGFVIRLEESDFPVYFGHFMGRTSKDKFTRPIKSLSDFGKELRNTIIWRIGEREAWSRDETYNKDVDYLAVGSDEICNYPYLYKDTIKDAGIMEYILEDYQIVLSRSIEPQRIIRVIPPMEQFGRILYKEKKQKYLEG